jgi:hypothetical protein
MALSIKGRKRIRDHISLEHLEVFHVVSVLNSILTLLSCHTQPPTVLLYCRSLPGILYDPRGFVVKKS